MFLGITYALIITRNFQTWLLITKKWPVYAWSSLQTMFLEQQQVPKPKSIASKKAKVRAKKRKSQKSGSKLLSSDSESDSDEDFLLFIKRMAKGYKKKKRWVQVSIFPALIPGQNFIRLWMQTKKRSSATKTRKRNEKVLAIIWLKIVKSDKYFNKHISFMSICYWARKKASRVWIYLTGYLLIK